MFIGIDIGTSAVKLVAVDEAQRIVAGTEVKLAPVQPRPLWSEDDPDSWWATVCLGLDQLAASHPSVLAAVRGIGLSGQMHGAVLLDASGRPVRPAILWNDGRAVAEASELADLGPELQGQVGVLAMAGFTGPKIKWLSRHEPETLARTRHLLLPKDFVRLHLTGDYATDVSDAAGTWLLDEASRCWSSRAVAACGVDPEWLPPVLEASAQAGTLRAELALRWGMPAGIPVAAGGGDTAVGGVGIGAIDEGQGFISLGTSGQMFVAAETNHPDAANLVHGFCHAAPGRWYRMAALLNGGSPLAAAARWTGHGDIGALLSRVEASFRGPSDLLALPYLMGERTPLNDPYARGAIIGLTASTEPTDIVQAVMESVAFSLADGLAALGRDSMADRAVGFIGGGSRSAFWGRIIASVVGLTLEEYDAAERGPAFGAARLARAAATGEPLHAIAIPPPVRRRIAPDSALQEAYRPRLAAFRDLYKALKPEFRRALVS